VPAPDDLPRGIDQAGSGDPANTIEALGVRARRDAHADPVLVYIVGDLLLPLIGERDDDQTVLSKLILKLL